MRVLLFANDLMPFGSLPTSGGGLRCFQLYEGLRFHGIEVVPSMPGFTFLAEKHAGDIPEEHREYLWSYENQDEILHRVKPDAVIFASNWDHFNLLCKPSCPLIIDLHGSRLIETAMFGTPVSPERKVSVFSQADCLLSAGLRQRLYFYGWLVQSGRIPEQEHFIRHVPVSLSPDLPRREYLQSDYPIMVSGGGWFPWQDQSRALYTICDTLRERQCGRIEIYGGPHKQQGSSAEEHFIRSIYENIRNISSECSQVVLSDYIGRHDLIDHYCKASVAVELMRYNLERELAFTTRTIEYLWCGLPVIYNHYGEISQHIRAYNAGWTIDPEDPRQIQKVVQEIYDSPDAVKTKGQNAGRLVRERFTWDKTIEPLVQFLNSPVIVEKSKPVLGAVHSRPSFLNAHGLQVELCLPSNVCEIRQRFVVPAENISGVEVPYTLRDERASVEIKGVTIEVRTEKGRILSKNYLRGDKLQPSGQFSLEFPFFRQPGGGDVLDFVVRLEGVNAKLELSEISQNTPLRLQCLALTRYPLCAFSAKYHISCAPWAQEQGAGALALSFIPAELSQMYQFRVLAKRALMLMQQREWKRVYRAIRRRVPYLKNRFAKMVQR